MLHLIALKNGLQKLTTLIICCLCLLIFNACEKESIFLAEINDTSLTNLTPPTPSDANFDDTNEEENNEHPAVVIEMNDSASEQQNEHHMENDRYDSIQTSDCKNIISGSIAQVECGFIVYLDNGQKIYPEFWPFHFTPAVGQRIMLTYMGSWCATHACMQETGVANVLVTCLRKAP